MVAVRLVSSVAEAFADSFRDAYVATGMNLTQSILLCTIGMAFRVQRSTFTVQRSEPNENETVNRER